MRLIIFLLATMLFATNYVQVIDNTLVVYDKPSINGISILELKKGEIVQRDKIYKKWIALKLFSDRKLYILRDKVKEVSPFFILDDHFNIIKSYKEIKEITDRLKKEADNKYDKYSREKQFYYNNLVDQEYLRIFRKYHFDPASFVEVMELGSVLVGDIIADKKEKIRKIEKIEGTKLIFQKTKKQQTRNGIIVFMNYYIDVNVLPDLEYFKSIATKIWHKQDKKNVYYFKIYFSIPESNGAYGFVQFSKTKLIQAKLLSKALIDTKWQNK